MSNTTRNKMKRLQARDGNNCWLYGTPVDFTLPMDHKMRASLDHYVPKKWGGRNALENLKLAHQHCNSTREQAFPDTMIFDQFEILALTNPNQDTGQLSKKAQKAIGFKTRRQIVRATANATSDAIAYHPSMPLERR